MSMSHPFVVLKIDDNLGNLILTPCPGTQEVDLQHSLEQLARAGVRGLLTLMPTDEMQRNQVNAMPEICAALGIRWFHLPVEDDHAPGNDFESAWRAARKPVHQAINDGGNIAIHCKGGTGRTGTLAARILLERGLPLDEAIERVRSVRPNALQIKTQLDYVQALAKNPAQTV